MKKLSLIVMAVASVALAGDDFQASVSYTATAACSSALRPRTKYAVQCTTDCYVRVTDVTTAVPTSSNSVLLAAGKLYDTPTTKDQVYICAIRSAADGAMRIFINRGANE